MQIKAELRKIGPRMADIARVVNAIFKVKVNREPPPNGRRAGVIRQPSHIFGSTRRLSRHSRAYRVP
jgi:hypothetical protein